MTERERLWNRLNSNEILLLPGAADALTARLIEDIGFDAVYATGAGFANASFAVPDIGLVSAGEVFDHVRRITQSVNIPVVVDADTGYGDILQVHRTVRELELAGAAAIQLEDQVTSKRCGHFDNQRMISQEEMLQKISIAIASRQDPHLLIIGRTDARGAEGWDAAVRRARAYANAGADMIFVEALKSRQEVLELPRLVDAPLVANVVEGGKTPTLSAAELQDAGYKAAIFANTALRASLLAMREVLQELRKSGDARNVEPRIVTWEERQRLVRFDYFQDLEETYSPAANGGVDRDAL